MNKHPQQFFAISLFTSIIAALLVGVSTHCPAADFSSLVSASASSSASVKSGRMLVYFGTYTNGDSKGIYLSSLDTVTGKLTSPKLIAETSNPSFLAIHPSKKYLYAVNEIGNYKGTKSGAITAFAIDKNDGSLAYLNEHSSEGGAPCHLVVDSTGKNVLVANYTGGNVASLPIGKDGKLGKASCVIQHKGSSVNPKRQKEPHAHSINIDAANKFAFAADLGLDKVLVYRFDAEQGILTANDPAGVSVKPGAGPRHFDVHPNGKNAYVINEIQSTVTAFAYDSKKGVLKTLQTLSTLPKGFAGNNSTAQILVHPSGKFVYGSNRGHNSIAIYSVDAKTGKLTHVGNESTRGKTPRNFNIDPTGTFLIAANQSTNSVAVFRIDQKTGKLNAIGSTTEVPNPVCVTFLPMEK